MCILMNTSNAVHSKGIARRGADGRMYPLGFCLGEEGDLVSDMKVYFCPECGTYDFGAGMVCEDCAEPISLDGWMELSEDELAEFDYVEEFELPPGLPSWEYEVIRLKAVAEDDKFDYTTRLLNSMGSKGWELVGIETLGKGEGAHYGVFKRGWLEDF